MASTAEIEINVTKQADKNLEAAARALGLEPETSVAEEPAMAEAAPVEAPSDGGSDAQPDPGDGTSWYVVHTYSGYERKVQQSLEERGVEELEFKQWKERMESVHPVDITPLFRLAGEPDL